MSHAAGGTAEHDSLRGVVVVVVVGWDERSESQQTPRHMLGFVPQPSLRGFGNDKGMFGLAGLTVIF